jgi:hypothetical protein
MRRAPSQAPSAHILRAYLVCCILLWTFGCLWTCPIVRFQYIVLSQPNDEIVKQKSSPIFNFLFSRIYFSRALMSRKCFRYQFISILIRLTNQSFHIETARMVEHFQIAFHSEFQTA